jgi:metallophosphoesterase (TIGR00282 family)
VNILFIGDIVGNSGRKAVRELLPALKKEYKIHFCVANAENAAGGSGITNVIARELYSYGVDGITMGNHTWSKREIMYFIDSDSRIIRPLNYPEGVPGKGVTLLKNEYGNLGIINLMGRVFMDALDCPFRAVDNALSDLKKLTKVVLVDMHAEATSEKAALAWHLDGRVAAVVGTHTHVQTADERILDCGTGFITDAGMTGPYEGILGVDKTIIIERFMNGLPAKFNLANGKIQLNAVFLEVDETCGITKKIERISRFLKEGK